MPHLIDNPHGPPLPKVINPDATVEAVRETDRVKWFNEKTSIGFVVHDGNGDDRCAAKLR